MAFYSSRLGGITTDPALMVVPMDDHLVHRGHAVFDTATMTQVRQCVLLRIRGCPLQMQILCLFKCACCAASQHPRDVSRNSVVGGKQAELS